MSIHHKRQESVEAVDSLMRQIVWHAQKQSLHTLSRPEIELTLPQMITLYAIHSTDICRMSELADLTQQSAGTLTGIVDRLISDGLVARVRDNDDRRVVHVELTTAGKARLTMVERARRDDMSLILGQLSDQELSTFAELLNHFLVGVHRVSHAEHEARHV